MQYHFPQACRLLSTFMKFVQGIQRCLGAMLQVLQHQTEETKQAQEEVAGRLALLEQRFGTSGAQKVAHQVCNTRTAVHCLGLLMSGSAMSCVSLSSNVLAASVILV